MWNMSSQRLGMASTSNMFQHLGGVRSNMSINILMVIAYSPKETLCIDRIQKWPFRRSNDPKIAF